VSGLQLDGALVILTGCEGAASEVLPGEEILSISRAFLAAGARDVIASQWAVFDAGIQHVLTSLYDRLRAGHDAATALAQAQRDCITMQDHASVLIWGGLHVIGAGTTGKATADQRGLL
jgi:CHAT domain-containing protein